MLLNRHVQMMLGFVAIASIASGQDEARAATLEVTATVPNACTVAGGTLDFGTYPAGPAAPSVEGSGTFTVQCTAPSSVVIALDGGLHDGATGNNTRAMKGPGANSFLDYLLFVSPGFSTPWAPGTAVPFTVSTGANEITVNGIIDPQQTVPGGQYSDTVQITMTFN